jgi:nucleoside-diphosphate-sugar epimerase
MLQTIIGSGGGIGIPLAEELKRYTDRIRLVSRHPVKVNDTDELFPADVSDTCLLEKAISGSEIVFVTIGFQYNLKIWQRTWPSFMKSVIEACEKYGSKLVFFDNVYMYDRNEIPFMTEKSKINAPSEKGKVRQQLREMIMREVEKGKLSALIARSADFYGPDNKNSVLSIMVADNLVKGKKAQAFGNIDMIHTYTYTPDAAKATALLGNTPDAFNQEWHVPTTKERITGRQWIELIADELHTKAKIQPVPKLMIQALGIFIPAMREFPEMLYQYEQDYIFDSSRFESRFGISATKPVDGIKRLVEMILS